MADWAASAPKGVFTDKDKAKIEDSMHKIDLAARPGMRASSFLLLLIKYLVSGCEEDSTIPHAHGRF